MATALVTMGFSYDDKPTVNSQDELTVPNPPIAEEFWGIWMSQQGIDAEETPWEGMRSAITVGVIGRRPPPVMRCEG